MYILIYLSFYLFIECAFILPFLLFNSQIYLSYNAAALGTQLYLRSAIIKNSV